MHIHIFRLFLFHYFLHLYCNFLNQFYRGYCNQRIVRFRLGLKWRLVVPKVGPRAMPKKEKLRHDVIGCCYE